MQPPWQILMGLRSSPGVLQPFLKQIEQHFGQLVHDIERALAGWDGRSNGELMYNINSPLERPSQHQLAEMDRWRANASALGVRGMVRLLVASATKRPQEDAISEEAEQAETAFIHSTVQDESPKQAETAFVQLIKLNKNGLRKLFLELLATLPDASALAEVHTCKNAFSDEMYGRPRAWAVQGQTLLLLKNLQSFPGNYAPREFKPKHLRGSSGGLRIHDIGGGIIWDDAELMIIESGWLFDAFRLVQQEKDLDKNKAVPNGGEFGHYRIAADGGELYDMYKARVAKNIFTQFCEAVFVGFCSWFGRGRSDAVSESFGGGDAAGDAVRECAWLLVEAERGALIF